jgi:hypothetical protein
MTKISSPPVSSLALLSAALFLSGCAVPTGPVEVTRYNRVAEGIVYGSGSYSVGITGQGNAADSLAASPYTVAIAREMQRIGYTEKSGGKDGVSDVIADVDIITTNHFPPKRSPVSVGVGGSTGSYGSGVGLGIGINLGGGPKPQVETTLSVKIRRRSDSLVIWEGKAVQSAKAGSPAAQTGIAASKLATALFQDFPGKSGETVRVP